MNYLRLSECYRYFDSDNVYYFNREDYKFYSEEEMKQALLYWNKNDFVLVQHTSSLEVAKAYLIFLNNKNQIKKFEKMDKNTFIHEFHIRFERDNGWDDSYYRFYRKYLIEYGAKWCDKMGIRYSKK